MGDVKHNQPQIWIYFLCLTSILIFSLSRIIPKGSATDIEKEMLRASEIMQSAASTLKECQLSQNIVRENPADINQTGFIGLEFSPITTSVGSLEAKRTTTNPNFAGLVVFLLNKAGVKKGDTITVGASGSFPALIVAVLSAAEAMEVKPLMICSLGASQWGANISDFHCLDMLECLWKNQVFDMKPAAFSLGGDRDVGEDIDEESRDNLINDIKKSGIFFLQEPDLGNNVKERMRIYEELSDEAGIKTFINIGGSYPNMGIDSSILDVKPGLSKIRSLPPVGKRGVLQEMAALKIPVIHLLFIKGLVKQHGLPWDPIPLPKPGEGRIYETLRERQISFLALALLDVLFVLAVSVVLCKKGKQLFYA
jgi:poly-gamma-glutamate system protein